ncbi:MAG: signal peptidase I [Kineosporiaceae bacterium]
MVGVRRIGALALQFVAVAYLTVVASLLFWSHAPSLIGWQPRVVLSGSMMPVIAPGDVTVIAPTRVGPATLPPGRIVLVRDATKTSGYYLHRLVRYEPSGVLITKGDANQNNDSDTVAPESIKGELRLVVPMVGRPVIWMQQHDYLALLLVAVGTWASLTVVLSGRHREYAPA